jgi:acyl-CoA synthetase (AMP-forming)/AMP-acid ligase II
MTAPAAPQVPDELGLLPSPARPEIPGGGPQSVAAILDPILVEDPGREALVGRHGRLGYAELDREANRAAHALAALGAGPGERVAACLPNDVDIAVAFLATQRLGAIWVGVNRALAPPEKAYLLRDCGARVYLAAPDLVAEIEAQRAGLPELGSVVPVDPGSADCAWARLRREAGRDERPAVAIDPFAPAAIAYTSGTTGFPKGAVHSQHNLLVPGAVAHLDGRFPPGTRQGAVLPLTILNLIVLELLVALYDGRCLVCIDRIDAEGLAEWIRRERVGTFSGVPTIFHDLLTHPDVKPADLASLVEPIMGGAEAPPEVMRLFRERFHKEVRIGYGMTEAPTAIAWSDGQIPPAPGLCGRPIGQLEIEVLDEQGRPLPQGEVGEICLRPARRGRLAGIYTPMLGYWKRPEATLAALRDGYYHTGDLGYFAEDGNLYIRGRRNELILRGGANVYPAEVERVLQQHPAVAAAAVLGLPDERLGERVVAVAQLEPGARADEEELRAFVREQLARYKVPDRIRFAQALPRNAMGKVVKRELRPLFEEG